MSRNEPDMGAYTKAGFLGGFGAVILGVGGFGLTFSQCGFLFTVGASAGMIVRGLFVRIENLEDEVRAAREPRKPKRRR